MIVYVILYIAISRLTFSATEKLMVNISSMDRYLCQRVAHNITICDIHENPFFFGLKTSWNYEYYVHLGNIPLFPRIRHFLRAISYLLLYCWFYICLSTAILVVDYPYVTLSLLVLKCILYRLLSY